LFKFDEAFALNQQWLTHHPDDILAQADLAEKYFTTGRFDQCEQRIEALLINPEANIRSALLTIKIAVLLALNRSDRVPTEVESLIGEIARQPADFKVEWEFAGTRYFINRNRRMSRHRAWLNQLFDVLGSRDRGAILQGLQDVKEGFKAR
jgi:tetratricopeptide repeat protein